MLRPHVDGAVMPIHKFKIGQTVYLKPALHRNVPGGAYIITTRMPDHDGEFEYRVRSMSEPHERVVGESSIVSHSLAP
jgi:hypothetical protein